MEKLPISDGLKKLLSVTTVFITISTLVVVFIGWASSSINNQNKKLNIFLTNSENIQANFEKSLQMYTASTEKIIEFLLSLRPSNEEQYIKFISEVEDLGKSLSLNVTLKSIDKEKQDEKENTLLYSVTYFSNQKKLPLFLHELENLPYFVKITSIKYLNPENLKEEQIKKDGNVEILIKLYTK